MLVRKLGQNANLVNRAYLVKMLTRLLSWSEIVEKHANVIKDLILICMKRIKKNFLEINEKDIYLDKFFFLV